MEILHRYLLDSYVTRKCPSCQTADTLSSVAGLSSTRFRPATTFKMEPSRDDLRHEFQEAFRQYSRIGRILCDVLIETRDVPTPERLEKVQHWQKELNAVRERYERARAAYVTRMLAEVHVEYH
jgi:hypothetical protein